MDGIMNALASFGPVGAVAAILLYQVIFLQGKVISIIENNTRALTEMKAVIEKCQLTHAK